MLTSYDLFIYGNSSYKSVGLCILYKVKKLEKYVVAHPYKIPRIAIKTIQGFPGKAFYKIIRVKKKKRNG